MRRTEHLRGFDYSAALLTRSIKSIFASVVKENGPGEGRGPRAARVPDSRAAYSDSGTALFE